MGCEKTFSLILLNAPSRVLLHKSVATLLLLSLPSVDFDFCLLSKFEFLFKFIPTLLLNFGSHTQPETHPTSVGEFFLYV